MLIIFHFGECILFDSSPELKIQGIPLTNTVESYQSIDAPLSMEPAKNTVFLLNDTFSGDLIIFIIARTYKGIRKCIVIGLLH